MSVDARIRKGLTMIDKELPSVDAVEGYEELEREIRRDSQRRRTLIGVAAAAVLVVTAGAVLLHRNHADTVQPSGPPDTSTFQSQAYGYSIALPQGWTTVAAAKGSDDKILIPDTDTTVEIYADYLGQQSFTAWANQMYRATLNDPGVPAQCPIVAPLEWPRFPIGNTQGYLLQKCNQALGIAPVGNRVYVFIWGNRTFDVGKHYPQSRFQTLLAGVTLPDSETASRPLNQRSPSQGG